MSPASNDSAPWLVLIHQIPLKPNYLRIKIGRRLARIGAVALKNTVYVLPNRETTLEDFQWIVEEVASAGGEATLFAAHLLDGLDNRGIEALFRAARDVDYDGVADELRGLHSRCDGTIDDDLRHHIELDLTRFERRLGEIEAIDFFGGSNRAAVHRLLATIRGRMASASVPSESVIDRACFSGRTWVTRSGIHVDRIASAWLILRWIDPLASFKFVGAKGYVAAASELRFDMVDGEFTHEGDLCTFEVLCRRFSLEVPGLAAIAQMVHDIDLKDGKFSRPEAAGLAVQIAGLALLHRDDTTRVARGCELFDELLAYFAKIDETQASATRSRGSES